MDRQLLLLGLLRIQKMHGYQLNDFLDRRLHFITDLKRSTAYYTLGKLAEQAYISEETERQGNRPERRVYKLTEKGAGRFHDLLRANLGRFHRTFFRDDIGVLFMSQLPAGEVHAALLKKRQEAQAALEAIGSHVDHDPDSPVQYVIEHQRAHLRTDLAWIDRLLARTAAALAGDEPWPEAADATDPALSLCLAGAGDEHDEHHEHDQQESQEEK
jgi:DNA-binding PadR family transcriptional regulator